MTQTLRTSYRKHTFERFGISAGFTATMHGRGCCESFVTPVTRGCDNIEAAICLGIQRRDSTSAGQEETTPESLMMQSADRTLLMEALEQLPVEWRETIILRELEGLPYREIAAVTDCPIGTVMSRLARGRARLQEMVAKIARAPRSKEARHGM